MEPDTIMKQKHSLHRNFCVCGGNGLDQPSTVPGTMWGTGIKPRSLACKPRVLSSPCYSPRFIDGDQWAQCHPAGLVFLGHSLTPTNLCCFDWGPHPAVLWGGARDRARRAVYNASGCTLCCVTAPIRHFLDSPPWSSLTKGKPFS